MNKVYVGFYGVEMPELILYTAGILKEMNVNSIIADYSVSQELLPAFRCDIQENNTRHTVSLSEYGPINYKNTIYFRKRLDEESKFDKDIIDASGEDTEIILINYGFSQVIEDRLSVIVIVTDEMLHHIQYIERLPVSGGKAVNIVVKESVGYSGALLKVKHLSEGLIKTVKHLRLCVIKLNGRDRKLALLSVYNETFKFNHISNDYQNCLDGIVHDIMCERSE